MAKENRDSVFILIPARPNLGSVSLEIYAVS